MTTCIRNPSALPTMWPVQLWASHLPSLGFSLLTYKITDLLGLLWEVQWDTTCDGLRAVSVLHRSNEPARLPFFQHLSNLKAYYPLFFLLGIFLFFLSNSMYGHHLCRTVFPYKPISTGTLLTSIYHSPLQLFISFRALAGHEKLIISFLWLFTCLLSFSSMRLFFNHRIPRT